MNSAETHAIETEPAKPKDDNSASLINEYPATSVEQLKQIISDARSAQNKWQNLSYHEKSSYLCKVRDYIVENCDSIVETISNENGKIRMDALSADVMPITMAISYYCKNGKRYLKDRKIRSGNIFLINKRSIERKVPYGVVGIISPWNYPFSIPMFEVIIALLSGNAVILKVAKETLGVGKVINEAFKAAGFPENVFNYVNMPGRLIGETLLDNGINKIYFTGSINAGKSLLEKASKTLTPVSLELGGNDPMIVLEDADLDRAASGALWGGFHNAGQSCGGVERIYVHSNCYNAFLEKLKSKIESLNVGSADDLSSEMGSITTQDQFDIINEHVDDAVKNGAKLYASSNVNSPVNGNKLMPARMLVDVDHSMKIMKEETFGPVVGVMKFNDVDEAVALANDSDLGLTASIWTKNKRQAMKIAGRLQVGVVNINDHLMSHGMAETSWGGMKNSGGNRTHGEQGFIGMTQSQIIVHDMFHFLKKDFWWHPYDKNLYDAIKGVMYTLYSPKFKDRINGMIRVLKVSGRIFKR